MTVTYTAESGATVTCQLDGAAFAICPATYSVEHGGHTLTVRATDAAGNATTSGSIQWTTNALLWEFATDGTPGSPVIASDGTIYLPVGRIGTDTTGYLYAINPDGTQKWRALLNILPSETRPAVASDGTIYVHGNGLEGTSSVEKLQAIRSSDGSVLWTFLFNDGGTTATSERQSSPVVASDGVIYVGSLDGNLYAINSGGTTGGTKRWRHSPFNSPIQSSPVIAPDGSSYVIYVHDESGLFAYRPTGDLKWSFRLSRGVAEGSPLVGPNGVIYFARPVPSASDPSFSDSTLYAVNANGSQRWTADLTQSDTNGVASTPAIASDGTLYVGDTTLYAIDASGSRKWEFTDPSGDSSSASPILGPSGKIYWKSPTALFILDPTSGLQVGEIDLSDVVFTPPPDATPALSPAGLSPSILYVPTAFDGDPLNLTGENGLRAYQTFP